MPILREAQVVGLVGPGPVEAHLAHVQGFAEVLGQPASGTMLDLGSGAGLPGLVLALQWPLSQWVLLDAKARSTTFLADAVRRLGVDHRVRVVSGRAEVVAHDATYRGSAQVVVARSVAAPAAVAECAAGFLVPGGRLVVSEPPGAPGSRWDEDALKGLGLGPPKVVQSEEGLHFSVLEQRQRCPDRFPRRSGVPAKRPLF